MSVCVDYNYVVFGSVPSNWYVICQSVWIIIILFLVLIPLIGMQYVSLCELLLFCFGTVPSN